MIQNDIGTFVGAEGACGEKPEQFVSLYAIVPSCAANFGNKAPIGVRFRVARSIVRSFVRALNTKKGLRFAPKT